MAVGLSRLAKLPRMDSDQAQRNPYVGFLIRRAQQAHVAVWSSVVSTEITSVQFGVLSALGHSPGLGQVELGERLDLDRSTIADIVARLERRGLVTRVRDVSDRRRNVLTLTERGQSNLDDLLTRIDQVDARLTARLTDEEQRLLRRLLLAVVEAPEVREMLDDEDPAASA